MEFAKYYDVSDIVDIMIKNEDIDCYPTGEEKFEGVYVCMDTNDFWISRISKGYNEGYEKDEHKYIVEINKISIYDVMDKLHELFYINFMNLKQVTFNLSRKIKFINILNRFLH